MGYLYDTLTVNDTDDWMTPRAILDVLGPFDLDPCAVPEPRPSPTAACHIARPDDGLAALWQGRVWLNPPYSDAGRWVARLAVHGTGTALIFARTETRWFADHVWASASALLFVEGRISFMRRQGRQMKGHNAPAPSVLAAYGDQDADALAASGIRGAYTRAWRWPQRRLAAQEALPLPGLQEAAS